jgi:hypothetical protein
MIAEAGDRASRRFLDFFAAKFRAGEMVGDYRRAQRNGRTVADAIGERKKGQG